MVLALTFHAVLEGIAVGLENDVNDVWLLFAGMLKICKHLLSFTDPEFLHLLFIYY